MSQKLVTEKHQIGFAKTEKSGWLKHNSLTGTKQTPVPSEGTNKECSIPHSLAREGTRLMDSGTSEYTEGALLSGWASGDLEWRSGYENKEKQTLEPLYCPSVKQSLSQRVFITYYVSVITTSTDQKTWCEVVRISSDWVRGHFQPRDRITLDYLFKEVQIFPEKWGIFLPSANLTPPGSSESDFKNLLEKTKEQKSQALFALCGLARI